MENPTAKLEEEFGKFGGRGEVGVVETRGFKDTTRNPMVSTSFDSPGHTETELPTRESAWA